MTIGRIWEDRRDYFVPDLASFSLNMLPHWASVVWIHISQSQIFLKCHVIRYFVDGKWILSFRWCYFNNYPLIILLLQRRPQIRQKMILDKELDIGPFIRALSLSMELLGSYQFSSSCHENQTVYLLQPPLPHSIMSMLSRKLQWKVTKWKTDIRIWVNILIGIRFNWITGLS